jgi:hypothetical protein
VGEAFEETLRDIQRQIAPPSPAFVIFNDCEEEK